MNFSIIALLAASMASSDPAGAVRAFYTGYQSLHVTGLPDSRQSRQLAPHLSEALTAALARAAAEQKRCQKAHSDEKPPWIEGDLFSSNFEGFTKFTVGTVTLSGPSAAEVTVDFEYVEGGHTVRWKDRVLLINSNGKWLVDDLRFKGSTKLLRASLLGRGCQ